MVEVKLLIPAGRSILTEVWISDEAERLIRQDVKDAKACVQKLLGFAQAGFWRLEGEENAIIRHEVGGAYRIRWRNSSLFRIIGFYETEQRKCFVILDAFEKDANGYTKKQWGRIQAVAQIKQANEWRRRTM